MNRSVIALGCVLLGMMLYSCDSGPKIAGTDYDHPSAIDTRDREIEYQIIRIFRADGIEVRNDFAGARLSDFRQEGADSFRLVIRPENRPINNSPWFAFELQSDVERQVLITLDYGESRHRYIPKWSVDGEHWTAFEPREMEVDTIEGSCTLRLTVGPEPIRIAGQEMFSPEQTDRWADSLVAAYGALDSVIGYSVLGHPIRALTLGNPEAQHSLVLMGRVHPPEVSGYICLRAFVRALLESESALPDKRIILFPMLNPDGVRHGHWRHNAQGVDLNRDWYAFNQPETRAVRDYLNWLVSEGGIIDLGIDFHSSDEEMFYAFDSTFVTSRTGLGWTWVTQINEAYPALWGRIEASDHHSPSAKYFFYNTLKTELVTYETHDESPREQVREKAGIAVELLAGQLDVSKP